MAAIPSPTTTVLVDDSNTNIQYGPGWANSLSSLLPTSFDYPMYGTLHETTNTTDLKFSFSGSSITACGQVPGGATLEDGNLWHCFMDDVRVLTVSGDGGDGICCSLKELPEGQVQHEIHISVNASEGRPILFDYLTYETFIPVPAADLLLNSNYPMFNFSDGWERQDPSNFPSAPRVTTQVGADFTFEFNGSAILWFGLYNTTFAEYSPSQFSVSVDNEEPGPYYSLGPLVSQNLNGSFERQSLLFGTPAYPRGRHLLKVVYKGLSDPGGKPIPLSLTSLVVRNGTTNPNMSATPTPTILTTPSTTLTTSPTINATTTGKRNLNVAIVVGSSSTALVLVLLILGIFCMRRRMKKRKRASVGSSTSSLEPFNHDSASAPAGTRQKSQRIFEVQEQPISEPAGVEAPPSYDTGPYDSPFNTEPIGIAL